MRARVAMSLIVYVYMYVYVRKGVCVCVWGGWGVGGQLYGTHRFRSYVYMCIVVKVSARVQCFVYIGCTGTSGCEYIWLGLEACTHVDSNQPPPRQIPPPNQR